MFQSLSAIQAQAFSEVHSQVLSEVPCSSLQRGGSDPDCFSRQLMGAVVCWFEVPFPVILLSVVDAAGLLPI